MAVRALGQAVEQRETAPERLNQPRPAALSRGMGAALGNPLHRPPVGRPFGSSARSRITAGCLPSGGVDREGSLAIKEGEPAQFSEPGLALVRADGTLYAIWIQSMPFARPHLNDVLSAIDFVIKENYPARGEA